MTNQISRDDIISHIDMESLALLAKSMPEEDRDIATDTYYFGLIFREYLIERLGQKDPDSKYVSFIKNDIFYRALMLGAIPLLRFSISRISHALSARR